VTLVSIISPFVELLEQFYAYRYMDLNVKEYFKRIGYAGKADANLQTLREIHRLHLLSVPFENLDIHFGSPIYLNTESFFDKIVKRNRGGFCYELNGLFFELLQRLGFNVQMLSARVANPDGSLGPDFDHMTLLVQLDEPWIADVGFGDSFMEPLRLNDSTDQFQNGRLFKFVQGEDGSIIYQAEQNGAWLNQFVFTLQPHELNDFSGMCHYQQTSPDSSFTKRVVCSVAKKNGRITLTDQMLIVTKKGKRKETKISGEKKFHSLLKKHFGIVLS
jgi:N-hydroxyarylamine O-acetyltransferase